MLNRTIAVVGGLLLLLVAVGAAQVVADLTDDGGDTAEAAFPDVAPYIEPTATATLPELPAEDVPGRDIADVPRYPESVRVAFGTTETESEAAIELEYQTLDPLDRVHEHVLAIVDTYGWSLTHEAFSGDERTFVLAREGESVEIHLRSVDDRTVMSVSHSAIKAPEPEPTPEPEPDVQSEVVPEQTVQPVSEPEPEPEQADNPSESSDKDEPEEKPEESEDKPDKPENENKGPGNNNGNGPPENKGPGNNNGNGNGPPEDKGPGNNSGNGNGNGNKKN